MRFLSHFCACRLTCTQFATVWLSTVALCVSSFAAPQSLGVTELRSDLASLLDQEKLAGLVYAVVEPATADIGALGFAHLANAAPMRPDAKVQVGSIAKTVISLGVLRLATVGTIDLDAPISKYVSQPQLINAWASTTPVTLRHLLDQTAGLNDVRLRHIFSAANTPDMPLQPMFDDDPALRVLRTQPGLQFSYTNWGHTLAAHVVEAVTGERYEIWFAREVLAALDMRDSTLGFTAQSGAHSHDRLAWGHIDDSSVVASMPMAPRPAAQFTTTASDMAKLMRFLMGDGQVAGREFIHTELMRGLGVATATDAAKRGVKTGYGLGIFTRDRHGAVGLCHGGSTAGFRAIFCVYRDQQRGFFIAQNSDRENARYDLFERRMIEHLEVANRLTPISESPTSPSNESWQGRYVPAPSRFESWVLLDRLLGYWSLDLNTARFTLTPASGEARRIEISRDGLIRQDDRVQHSAVLTRNAAGEYLIAGGYLTLRKIDNAEFYTLWASVVVGLAGFLYGFVVPIYRAVRSHTVPTEPTFFALMLLAVAAFALFMQPWQILGDKTFASVSLFAITLAMPLLFVTQIVRSVARREKCFAWRSDVIAALCSLQFCALLFAFDLLPTALWRL
jgi:CubicO group peptidase (beta-lactamase class C family)